MSKTQRQRQRQRRHNVKLSRRMKKRGGVKHSHRGYSNRASFLEPGIIKPLSKENLQKSFKDKYEPIQNYYIKQFRNEPWPGWGNQYLKELGHDGSWMCIKQETKDPWNWDHKKVVKVVDDSVVVSPSGWINEIKEIKEQNKNHIFCVPTQYERMDNTLRGIENEIAEGGYYPPTRSMF